MVSLLSKVNVLFLPYDSNDHKNSIRDFIDHTQSNSVWLRRSNTPYHCGVPYGVICGNYSHKSFNDMPNS